MPPLHGTLGLARAEGSATGLRFLGHDEPLGPEVAIGVGDLPDAELTLRAFVDDSARAGYVAALAEQVGNAVAWLETPPGAGPPLLLIARFDRPRREGSTLEEAIPLVGEVPGVAAAYGERRARAFRDRERREEADAIALKWSRELAEVRGIGGMLLASDLNRLEFIFPGSDILGSVWLTKVDGGLHLGWNPIKARFEGDLRDEWEAGFRRLGLSETAGAGLGIVVAGLDVDAKNRIKAVKEGLASLMHTLGDRENRRRRIDRAASDGNALRVLERAAAGLLVMAVEKFAPCGQMSPRSRKAQTVAMSLVVSLVNDGLLEPLWGRWDDGARTSGRRAPSLYAITDTGRALVEGRMSDAAEGVRLRPGDRWLGSDGGARFEDLGEAMAYVASGVPEPLRPVEPEIPVVGVPRAADFDAWGWLVSEAVAGRILLSPDGRSFDDASPGYRR